MARGNGSAHILLITETAPKICSPVRVYQDCVCISTKNTFKESVSLFLEVFSQLTHAGQAVR